MKILMDRKLLPGLMKVSLPFCEQYVISKQHRIKFVGCRSSCGLIKDVKQYGAEKERMVKIN